MLRAAAADVTSAHLAQGGSTLTQQLVRNLYLGDERTVSRKLQEGCLADQLARRWSKKRVLASYLNTVFYGQQAYGIQAAAQTYFSTPTRSLTLLQAALLAGLPQAPTLFDPLRNPESALERLHEVLKAMLDNGVIGAAAYRRAVHAPLGLKPSPIGKQQRQSFFVNYIDEQLVARYGAATVRQGGLAVHTTLDWSRQRAAERAIKSTLSRPHDPASALVAIDPADGAIRAMTSLVPGKPTYQFNLAVQGRRQTGSSFKLFVLTDAIQRGINPHTTTYLSAPFRGPPSDPYLIQTDTRTYTGRTPIDAATAESDNRLRAPHARPRRVERREDSARDGCRVAAATRRDDRARSQSRVAARDGVRLRDRRGPRRLPHAVRDLVRVVPRWTHRSRLEAARRTARAPGRRRGRGHARARGRHRARDGNRRRPRTSGGRQDGHDELARGRVVRRLHARPRGGRLGRLPLGPRPDAARARHQGLRGHLPGSDLAEVHDRCVARPPCCPVPPRRCHDPLAPLVRALPIRAELRECTSVGRLHHAHDHRRKTTRAKTTTTVRRTTTIQAATTAPTTTAPPRATTTTAPPPTTTTPTTTTEPTTTPTTTTTPTPTTTTPATTTGG